MTTKYIKNRKSKSKKRKKEKKQKSFFLGLSTYLSKNYQKKLKSENG
jgi:hypothetical protein